MVIIHLLQQLRYEHALFYVHHIWYSPLAQIFLFNEHGNCLLLRHFLLAPPQCIIDLYFL